MDCIIIDCVRDPQEGHEYCNKHQLAADNIEETFAMWQVAYGDDYSYEQYLTRLATDYEIGSGDLVIEIAEHLLNQD